MRMKNKEDADMKKDSKVRLSSVTEVAGLTPEQIIASTVNIDKMNMEYEKSDAKKLWDSLSEEDKKDLIQVDGRTYVRKVYEARQAKAKASEKYDKANTKQVKMKLNLNTDADIIEKLDSVGNVQGYIKELIRKDIGK